MTTPNADAMRVRRLGWAGVEIRLDGTTVLIDALENVESLEPVLGPPKRPLPPVEMPPGTHALITHLHPDHYDRELLTRLDGVGTIGCHAVIAPALAEDGITAVAQELGQPRHIGPLTVTPVTSLDWRGTDSDQVAWIVDGAGVRIIHCGDTMWHGDWWQIARDHGPFDIAFLPVNGVIARFEGYAVDVPVTWVCRRAPRSPVPSRRRHRLELPIVPARRRAAGPVAGSGGAPGVNCCARSTGSTGRTRSHWRRTA